MSTRCYVPAAVWSADAVTLDKAASHHVTRVLRMGEGDPIEVFDGLGRVGTGTIASASKSAVEVRIDAQRHDQPPQPRITLVQALIKPQHMDWVMRKACELGVGAVQPVVTNRCVVRTRERPDRWIKTMISAAEQCGTNWLPDIRPVLSWSEWLSAAQEEPVFVCALTDAQPFKTVLQSHLSLRQATICIGPEGDFEPDELKAALDQGAIPVSLGDLTLRAETAALAAATILRYEFGG